MRIGNQLKERKLIMKDVRQGCVLSPVLFSLNSKMIRRSLVDEENIKVGGRIITNIYLDMRMTRSLWLRLK